jgi:predicted nucleic acid-binding protein
MPDRVVLDSNVLAAMFFKEDASQRALKAVSEPDLITLDLSVAEVGSVAWKLVILSGEDKDLTLTALQKCLSFISEACDIVRAQDLAAEAYEISMETKAVFYDSLFLALAKREQVPLLTLDKNLYKKAKASQNVRLI